MATANWTTDKYLEKIAETLLNIEIVGKVQSVEAVRSVNGRALKNFVVETNSRKRIACEAWGDGAELIDVVVKPDQKIRLTKVRVKESTYHERDANSVPFTIVMDANSKWELSGRRSSAAMPCVPEPADKVDDPLGFRVLMSKFFELCSNCNAHATVAIVKVTLPGKEARTMVFKNTPEPNYTRAESNFIKWWKKEYSQKATEQDNESGGKSTEIKMYMNCTPCEDCAELLKTLLIDYKNVKLMIYFLFVYADEELSDPKEIEDYVGRVTAALQHKDTHGNTLQMKKIDKDALIELLNKFDIRFKGYPSYNNFIFEDDV